MALPKKPKKLESAAEATPPQQSRSPKGGKRKTRSRSPAPPQPTKPETDLDQGFDLMETLDQQTGLQEDPSVASKATPEEITEEASDSQSQTHQYLRATLIIQKYVILSTGAGVLPAPILDIVLSTGLQVEMVRELAKLYEKDFSPTRAKYLIAALGGNSAIGFSAFWGGSVIKLIPGIGPLLGATVLPTAIAAYTYAIGRIFANYFEQGGSIFEFEPGAFKKSFSKQFKHGQRLVTNLKNGQAS